VISLATNITSLLVMNNLRSSQQAMQTSMERLSSGLRINSAKDDPAGHAIANRISMVQTAEGSLDLINDSLQRIRELSVQALNGTNSSEDRASIQLEIDQRLEEIDRVAEQSNFNGIKLIERDKTLNIQVGANAGDVIGVSFSAMGRQALGLDNFSVLDNGSATPKPMDVVDEAMKQVDRQRSYLGAVQNRFESVIDGLNTNIINTSAAQSRIQDADYAQEISNLIRAQLLQQVGIAMLTRVNQQPQMILRLLEGL